MITPTPEEKRAIASLKRVANKWPDSLWIFASDQGLTVMRNNDEGKHATLGVGKGMNPDYILDFIRIDAEGGDW